LADPAAQERQAPVYVLNKEHEWLARVPNQVHQKGEHFLLDLHKIGTEVSQDMGDRPWIEIGTHSPWKQRVSGKAGVLGGASLGQCSVPFQTFHAWVSKPTSVPVAAIASNFP